MPSCSRKATAAKRVCWIGGIMAVTLFVLFLVVYAIPGEQNNRTAENRSPALSERFFEELKSAAGVTLGRNPKAEILMVIGPSCPHCKKTWKEIRGAVRDGLIQVRLIPLMNTSGDLKTSALLLKAENPLEAWDRYVEGDLFAFEGEADGEQAKAVMLNNVLMEKWNIKATPCIVYRDKNNRIKIVKGEPRDVREIFDDLPG